MRKSHARTLKPGWQLAQCADKPVSLPVFSLVNNKLKLVTTVVIADDNPHARHGLRAVLSSHSNLEVVGEASQGDEAIALVETLQPDAALLDVRMPKTDGLQAARMIKKRWPQIRVVSISMYADYKAEALASGADVFLVKGCTAEELVTAIVDTQPKQEFNKD
jgi:DNA-binding NarL/FixJ family response regulator